MKNVSALFSNKDNTSVAIRLAGFFVPVLFFLYGLLIELGVQDSSHYFGLIGLIVAGFAWVSMGAYQYFVPSKSQEEFIFRITAYHIAAAIFVVYVTGFYTPMTALWLILLVATYIRIGFIGTIMSALLLGGLGFIDAGFHINAMSDLADIIPELSRNTILFMTVIITSSLSIILIDGKVRDHYEISKVRDQERIQHNQVEAIINTLSYGIVSTDSTGEILTYNAGLLDLLDTNKSIIGSNVDSLIGLRDSNGKKVKISTLFDSISSTFTRTDVSIANPEDDDDLIKIELTISPVSNAYSSTKGASIHGYVIMLRDITKAKTLEEERDEFISVVSHELRTPITVAEGTISNTQEMMKRADTPLSVLKPSIDLAHDQVVFLARMVNDLSTLSRAERGVGGEVEVISIDDLFQTLYREYQSQAKANNLKLDIDVPGNIGSVKTSRLYLTELIQNFITNSIKYTKEGTVTLRVKKTKKQVTMSVADTGIGISKHDQAKIFEKFYRSEDYRTRETGGTGLGLYVAHKLAHKLDTKIEMKSRLNHGSTFSITLPLLQKSEKE